MRKRPRPYEDYNAERVLERLNAKIRLNYSSLRIGDIYDDLSIFDWWPEWLTHSNMKKMKMFLENAIRLGYTGYVCFKVGASGCANGMWAHKKQTTDGYAPDGDFIYRSFTPDYTCWEAKIGGKTYPSCTGIGWDSCNTVKKLERCIRDAAVVK